MKNKLEPGEWVILRKDKVVGHDRDIRKIFEIASKYKDDEITISKEPAGKYCFY